MPLLSEQNPRYSVLALRAAWLVLIGVLLNGCQSLPFQPKAPRPTVQAEQLESHRFALNEHDDLVGQFLVIRTEDGDTLPDIARHFGLGYQEIADANPHMDIWLPEPDRELLLPLRFILPEAPRKGIVLNLANMRLFYYPEKTRQVISYPIGIGRESWSTPTGRGHIIGKSENPPWYVPASIRREHARKGEPLPKVVPAGPDNPLGRHALRLSMPSYLIHGTNKPYGVGLRVSHGCIRLYPEDIEQLFQEVAINTSFRIVSQPYLLGWHGDMLYLEAHRPLEEQQKELKPLKAELYQRLQQTAKNRGKSIDWEKVEQTLDLAQGIPTPILTGSGAFDRFFAKLPEVTRPAQFYGAYQAPPLTAEGWYLQIGDVGEEALARRLSALLIHQGPPIPARPLAQGNRYQVIAGPFANHEQAQQQAKRIDRDLELIVRILKPGQLNLSSVSEAPDLMANSKRLPSALKDKVDP